MEPLNRFQVVQSVGKSFHFPTACSFFVSPTQLRFLGAMHSLPPCPKKPHQHRGGVDGGAGVGLEVDSAPAETQLPERLERAFRDLILPFGGACWLTQLQLQVCDIPDMFAFALIRSQQTNHGRGR